MSETAAAYDDAANWWEDMMHRLGYGAAYDTFAAEALAGCVPRRILDIGTGTGDLALAAAKATRALKSQATAPKQSGPSKSGGLGGFDGLD